MRLFCDERFFWHGRQFADLISEFRTFRCPVLGLEGRLVVRRALNQRLCCAGAVACKRLWRHEPPLGALKLVGRRQAKLILVLEIRGDALELIEIGKRPFPVKAGLDFQEFLRKRLQFFLPALDHSAAAHHLFFCLSIGAIEERYVAIWLLLKPALLALRV